MRDLAGPFMQIKRHRAALAVLVASFGGLFLAGIALTLFVPELRPGSLAVLRPEDEAGGLGSFVTSAYSSGNVVYAMSVTLGVNLLWASLIQTTLPTFIIPYFGIFATGLRFFFWGVLFTPVGTADSSIFIHYVTLCLEGAGYTLAALAAWIYSQMFLKPQSYGFNSKQEGFKAGSFATLKIYLLITAVLVVAAAYEAVSVIYFIAD